MKATSLSNLATKLACSSNFSVELCLRHLPWKLQCLFSKMEVELVFIIRLMRTLLNYQTYHHYHRLSKPILLILSLENIFFSLPMHLRPMQICLQLHLPSFLVERWLIIGVCFGNSWSRPIHPSILQWWQSSVIRTWGALPPWQIMFHKPVTFIVLGIGIKHY